MATLDAPKAIPAKGDPNVWRKHFRKICFGTRAPGGKNQVSGIEATLRGQKLDESRVATPQITTIPDEMVKRINAARNNIRKVLDRYAFPCGERANRLVSIHHSEEFIVAFNAARAAFDKVADEIADQYDAIIAYNQEYWRPKFESDLDYQRHIGSRLPASKDALRKKFGVVIYDLEDDDMPAFFEDALLRDFFAEAKANAEELQEELRLAVHTQPIENLIGQCNKLIEATKAGTQISIATMTNFQAAIDLYKSCSDVMNPQLTKQVFAMARELAAAKEKAEARSMMGEPYTAKLKKAVSKMEETITAVVEASESELAQIAAAAPVMHERGLAFLDDFGSN